MPADYLERLNRLFVVIGGVYKTAAGELTTARKSVPASNLKQMIVGLEKVLQHTNQIANWQARTEIRELLDSVREEPLPSESFDRTKSGKTGPMGTTPTSTNQAKRKKPGK